MNCPACKTPKLMMSERSGIEIDYCPDCRGVWLDRGELDKLIQAGKAQSPEPREQPQQPQQHPQHYGGERHERRDDKYEQKYYKRKKSFLEEIFD